MDKPLGDHGEGEARGLWPLRPSTWPLSQRASSLLHVCYYKVFTCRGREILKVEYYFEYISSFFLIPPFFPPWVSPQHPNSLNVILDFYVCCALSFVLCAFLLPANSVPGG